MPELLLLAYDGSDSAKHALSVAPPLMTPRRALVVVVWQPMTALSSFAAAMPLDQQTIETFESEARESAEKLAAEGADLARSAGVDAEPIAVQATGPVWEAIVETAEQRDVAAIAMGSRGLSGMRQVLLGSVSEGVVRHTARPVLIVHPD